MDYYAVGIIAYECMLGRRPYTGKGRKEIRDSILAKQIKIQSEEAPESWSKESVDFINQLIQRKPIKRLGQNGPTEIKLHPWFKDFDWELLYDQTLKAPFVPAADDNFDKKNSESEWKDMNVESLRHCMELLQKDSVQDLFSNYEYDEEHKHMRGSGGPRPNISASQCAIMQGSLCGSSIMFSSDMFYSRCTREPLCNYTTGAGSVS